jgi:acetoacetate decarboxylase
MAFVRRDDKAYFMPITFGPSQLVYPEPGKKYYEPGEIHVASITYETDREAIEALLPECYTLNDPYVTVATCEFTNLGYLAGKAYNLININVPVHFKGERDDMNGDYILVMFENHGDPIIGGRDTMGYNKIYCDIPNIEHVGSKYVSRASNWDFRFMKMELDMSQEVPDLETYKANEARSEGKMNFKYLPHVMEKGEDPTLNYTKPAVAYPTVLPKWEKPADYPYEIRTPQMEMGSGTIEFYEPTWEEMPSDYHIGVGLSTLKCKRVIGAKHVVYDDPCIYNTCYRLR